MTSYLLSRFASLKLVPRSSSSFFCAADTCRLHRSTYATIAGIYFPTQQALKDKLKSFVKDENTILKPQNQKLAVEAVSSYDKVNSRGKVKRVYVEYVEPIQAKGKFGGLCMHVEIEGAGEVITVSYANVARAVGSPDEVASRRPIDRKYEALRHAVYPDILDFKNAKIGSQTRFCCEECGKQIYRSNCHVDHHGRDEFRHIVKMYQDEHAGGDLFAINDDEFVDYHRDKMNLRLVCARCNLTKPRKTSHHGW